jgi:hypothetical protein
MRNVKLQLKGSKRKKIALKQGERFLASVRFGARDWKTVQVIYQGNDTVRLLGDTRLFGRGAWIRAARSQNRAALINFKTAP